MTGLAHKINLMQPEGKIYFAGHRGLADLAIPRPLKDMVGSPENGYRIAQSSMKLLNKYQIVEH